MDGNPVTPTDLSRPKISVPDGIRLLLGGEPGNGETARPKAYAGLNQKDAGTILNPKPACPPERTAH